MKRAKRKSKEPSLASLRRKLDKVFAQFIRRRDMVGGGLGICVTCGYCGILQAGHFIKRQHLMTRWDERNAHGQCIRCNHFLGGNEAEYYRFMQRKYGQQVIDELFELKHKTVKYSRDDLKAMIEKYSADPR